MEENERTIKHLHEVASSLAILVSSMQSIVLKWGSSTSSEIIEYREAIEACGYIWNSHEEQCIYYYISSNIFNRGTESHYRQYRDKCIAKGYSHG